MNFLPASIIQHLPVLGICLLGAPPAAGDVDWSGYVSLEPRIFVEGPAFRNQPDAVVSASAVLAPELRYEWNRGKDRITLAPFLRWDADDGERTHADLREALWLHASGPWTWRVGLGRVFWGVTESRHLVDIVNQTDQVEDIDEEDKLGQPMIALERWIAGAGSFAVFVLPGFRERPFPAPDARLRGALPVDTGRTEYESSAGDGRLDWALRWSYSAGRWDLGASAFHGTSREPRLLTELDGRTGPILVPRYDVIGQLGVDLQYTQNACLWKFEATARHGHGKTFAAAVVGLEYTIFDLANRGIDLGLLLEYLYDGRDESAPPTVYDDDWFVGFRLGFNDVDDTAILGGAILDGDSALLIVEGERRLGESWKFEAEIRWFLDVNRDDPVLNGFRNDSFITLRLARYL